MTITDAVKKVVHKYMPESSKPLGIKPINGFDSWCASYAHRIIYADVDDTHAFGASRDSESIKEIQKCLKRLSYLIVGLEHTSTRHLDSHLSFYNQNAEVYGSLAHLLAELKVAELAVNSLRKNSAYGKIPSSKPNWRAISVAKCCRHIWAENAHRANPEIYGRAPLNELSAIGLTDEKKIEWKHRKREYDDFIEAFAPTTQGHNRPGPFGNFLEEIFECLGILGKDGGPVKAATALDALKKIESQEISKQN